MQNEHDLAKWLAGTMTPEELQDFEKTPEFHSYQKIATYSSDLNTSDFNYESVLQQIVLRPKAKTKVIPFKQWLYSAAAILIIGLGCFFFIQEQTISEQAIAGNQTAFSLPDQSLVTLNSDSEIQYKNWNWDKNRNLQLQGEAFFKVAKGQRFTVTTNLGTIMVLGTQFNVKARGNRFEVECFEGRVQVDYKGSTKRLTKGEIIVCDNGNLLDASPTNAVLPSWMQNKMRIISEELPTILSELERVYAVKIKIKNGVPNQKFTGFLPSDDLATAMKIIGNTYNFGYSIDTKNKVIMISK